MVNKESGLNILDNEEEFVKAKFLEILGTQATHLSKLIRILDQVTLLIPNVKKDRHTETIKRMLVQNVSLTNSALDSLSKGYLRISETLLRIVAESIIMAVYFYDCPNKEEEYRKNGHMKFNIDNPWKFRFDEIENKDRLFRKIDIKKNVGMDLKNLKNIFFDSSSGFVHQDVGVLHSISKDDKGGVVVGPNTYPPVIWEIALNRIFSLTGLSIAIIGLIFEVTPTQKFRKIHDKITLRYKENMNTYHSQAVR